VARIKRLTVDIDESLHKWLKMQAVVEGRTLRELVEEALTEYRRKKEESRK